MKAFLITVLTVFFTFVFVVTVIFSIELILRICEKSSYKKLGNAYLALLTHDLIYGTTEINDNCLEYYKSFLEKYSSKKGLVDLGKHITVAFNQTESVDDIVSKHIEYIKSICC